MHYKKNNQKRKLIGFWRSLLPTAYFLLPSKHRGFVLSELLVAMALLGVVGMVVANFQVDIFTLHGTTRDSLSVQHDVRQLLKTITAELRAVQGSDVGGYAIESAATSTLVFYSDVDGDGTRERVRYFLDGKTLKRGLVKSSGSPPAYILATETTRDLVASVVATSTPIFSYYGAGYVPALTPLSSPVAIERVRLVRIDVAADVNPVRSPGVIYGTTQVSIRNLKDNL